MNIGSIIKELRQKKKMSQEEIAEYLGVSTQAVSRWETSVSYPDITLLPLIANVFNVTVDYLLGTDKFKNDKLIEEVTKEYHKYQVKGDNVGAHKYMKEIYEKYPHVEKLQLIYADACNCAYNINRQYIDDAIEIIERLVRTTLNDDIKFEAYDTLFWLYNKKENKEKIKEIFNNHIKDKLKKDYYSEFILEGEELTISSQKKIRNVVDMLWDVMLSFRSNNSYDLETNIILTDKFNKIMTILYEQEDYGLQELWLLNTINRFAAIDCLQLDRIDDALNYIKLSVKYAIERDSRPNEFKHKSLLLNRLVDKQDNVTFSGNKQIYGNNCFTLYEDLQRGDFVKLKGNEEYITLLEILAKYKKQYNQRLCQITNKRLSDFLIQKLNLNKLLIFE